MMNLLALAGSPYENTARGILYVVYEIMWKLIYYVLTLIDTITELFYKIAGINVSDGVVENRNIFDQLLNQNIISSWYGLFTLIAGALVIIFTLIAILKSMASNDEKRSLGPIFKNIGLALLLLIVMGPIILLLISLMSNVAIVISSIGGNNNISIADIIFGNSGNLITVYNETYGTEFTSFRELGNDFLYELLYTPNTSEGATTLTFNWYIALVGGVFVLYNLAHIVVEIVKRIFNIVILYVASPFVISKLALDDGKSFKEWQTKFFYEFVLLLTQIGTFMLFIALVNVLNNIDFEGLTNTNVDNSIDNGLLEPDESVTTTTTEVTYSLLNGLGRTLIIMAAASVTSSSATMLTKLFSAKDSKTDSLLESVLNKLSSRATPTSRTRTITRNTTTTKKETVFVEPTQTNRNAAFASSDSSNASSNSNVSTNNRINQNININNKFTSNNTINNRTVRDGIQKGGYGSDSNFSPGNIYINATRNVEPASKGETFKFINSTTSKVATDAVKEYEKANTNLTSAINSGDSGKLQKTLNDYTKAYAKEAEVLSGNYRQFEMKANASMKSEISSQARQELKTISTAYRKAQLDYNKTANKLKQYDGERMSTADALKMKEQADKQRERLMSASNKAAQFYENQKKGE